MSNPKTNTTVSFTGGSGTETDGRIVPSVSIGLDDEKHLEIYNDSTKSVFETGERSYFKVYFSGDYRLLHGASTGVTKKEYGTGIKNILEAVTFQNTNTATLQYVPATEVTYTWLGKKVPPATPLFNGQNITLNNSILGIMLCTYGIEYHRLSLLVTESNLGYSESIPVIVVAVLNEGAGMDSLFSDSSDEENIAQAFVELTYTKTPSNIVTQIQVLDYSTGEGISGASVSVDGASAGSTDSAGKLSLSVRPGITHSIAVSATDYENTADDILDNESFIIPIA